ncbi:MAG: hypothetical protein JSS49_11155 [Planctomycetes bacterium]|nr:hypothetical protein [Planctomycetota bacterium]
MFRFSKSCSCVLALTLGLVIGCGSSGPPKTAKASGQVKLKGEPVTEGEIYFIAAEKGYSASSTLDSEGKFQITASLPPATYKVYFAGPKVTKPPMPGEPPPETKPFVVPNQYLSEATSGLSWEIKAGDNSAINFDL